MRNKTVCGHSFGQGVFRCQLPAGHDGQHLESVDSQNQRLVTDHGNRPVPSGEGGTD